MNNLKTYHVKIKGVTPFIMHNSEGADPQNKWTLQLSPLKAKRKKTEADLKTIRDLSFLQSLYWSDELNGLYIPTDNIRKMILEAGRCIDVRGAKKEVVGIRYTEYLGFPFGVKNRSDMEILRNDEQLRYFKIVTIARSKVPSVRAIFKEWSFELDVVIDDSIINPKTVERWFDYAGDRIGIGCRRPYGPTPGEFGRFIVEDFKEI